MIGSCDGAAATRGTLVGILGGGQLARMLAQAGQPLGLRFRVLDPAADASAGQVAEHVLGSFDDADALRRLANRAGCVTLETENVPPATIGFVRGLGVPVRPGRRSLEVSADRLREKRFLRQVGIPTAPFRSVMSEDELRRAHAELGGTVIAKTRTLGYDGRGQVRFADPDGAATAWHALGGGPLVVEGLVPFRRELSLVSVRSVRGEVRHYPLVENAHAGGILRTTRAPAAGVTPAVQATAEAWAERLLTALGHVGAFTIELFETADGLVVNELAPRVHNSGHWTIEGAVCSQFENHLRAVLGCPLGPTRARAHAGMVNLIGKLAGQDVLAADSGARVHLYGKAPRPGRKLGHITLVDEDAARLEARLARLEARLHLPRHTDLVPALKPEEESMDTKAPIELSRRRMLGRVLAGGAAAFAATALPATGAPLPDLPRPRTPDEALRRLLDGNTRFIEGRTEGLRRSLDRVRETAAGQAPFAAVLGCADSRVPPELLFDQGVGDLFVVRVAGNVATPEEIASLEFGVAVLGTQVLLVLGHSSCGAVKAALEGGAAPGQITALYQHFQPALASAGGDVDQAVELNVIQQREILRSGSPVLREALRAGTLAVEGAVYELGTGRVRMIGDGQRS